GARSACARLGAAERARRRHAQLLLEGARRRADHVALPPRPERARVRGLAAGSEELRGGGHAPANAHVALRQAEGHRARRAAPYARPAAVVLAQDLHRRLALPQPDGAPASPPPEPLPCAAAG